MRLQHLCLMAAVALGGTIAAGLRGACRRGLQLQRWQHPVLERGRRPRRFGATPATFDPYPAPAIPPACITTTGIQTSTSISRPGPGRPAAPAVPAGQAAPAVAVAESARADDSRPTSHFDKRGAQLMSLDAHLFRRTTFGVIAAGAVIGAPAPLPSPTSLLTAPRPTARASRRAYPPRPLRIFHAPRSQ